MMALRRQSSSTVFSLVALFCSFLRLVKANGHCTVCQDGSDILFPNAVVEETDQTCATLAREARGYTDPIACRYYHRYGETCGCTNVPPPETRCSLCQRGRDQIEDESKWLDGYDTTCGVLQTDAAWNLFATYSADEDDPINVDQDDCNYYHHIGSLCGCKRNKPPPGGCPLCVDGNPPLLPQKAVTPVNAAEATCADFSLFTQYRHAEGTTECKKLQSIVGSYCGCATNTPIIDIDGENTDSSSDPTTCDYCPQGLVTRDGWAPDVDFATGHRIFYFRDASCIKVTMLASTFDFPCGSAPRDFIEGCCEPAAELLKPEVFVQPHGSDTDMRKPWNHPDTTATGEGAPALQPQEPQDRYKVNWDEFDFSAAISNNSFSGLPLGFLLTTMACMFA